MEKRQRHPHVNISVFQVPEWQALKGKENRKPNQFGEGSRDILPTLTKQEKSLAQTVKERIIFQQ